MLAHTFLYGSGDADDGVYDDDCHNYDGDVLCCDVVGEVCYGGCCLCTWIWHRKLPPC